MGERERERKEERQMEREKEGDGKASSHMLNSKNEKKNHSPGMSA